MNADAATERTPGQTLPPAPPLADRLALPASAEAAPPEAAEQLYSFFARDFPVDQVLALFARAYKLNIVVDREVSGIVNVEFHDLPFDQAMEAILGSLGYYWERDGALVRVRATVTRVFSIDYIRLVRSGQGISEAQVSSGGGSGGSGSGGSGDGAQSGSSGGSQTTSGGVTVSQQDSVPFWEELEAQLKALLSPAGRVVLNRTAGTVLVSDQFRRVEDVRRYLAEVRGAVLRQVDIEVRIVEVALNDDFSLGVDWDRITAQFGNGFNADFGIGTGIAQPAGGIPAQPRVLSLGLSNVAVSGLTRISAVISALQQQGNVRVVSQPHIRTLNNQAAMIKIGTDRTFFRREQVTDSTSAGSTILSSDVPQVVTEGIVLGITPQVATDGWIMLDVYPVVTRVSSVTEVRGANGVVQSSAPNLDIRQASSLVRARDGETVVIGGLIQQQDSDSERGVPGFNRLPLLGSLFKGVYKARGSQELVVFLTPRVVETVNAQAGL
ncbi:MAG: type II secretion system protein GspD [Gammaproteobacteria bacterium]